MKNPYQQFFKQARANNQSSAKKIDIKKLQKRNGSPVKAKRKRPPFPAGAGLALLVTLSAALYVSYDLERIEGWIDSIEISVLGAASANPEKTDQAKVHNEEKSADRPEVPDGEAKSASTTLSAEELALFKSLDERRKALDLREKELRSLEEELQKQKESLDKRLAEIEQVRRSIATQLEEKVKVDQERVEQLVQFYSTMKPQQAAKIIETLNEDLAVEVLLKMKKKSAAEIMNLIDAQKAQRLSEKFAGYRRK